MKTPTACTRQHHLQAEIEDILRIRAWIVSSITEMILVAIGLAVVGETVREV